MGELLIGLTKYLALYNGERLAQALAQLSPEAAYESSTEGGAIIVDKYGAKEGLPIALGSTGTAFDQVIIGMSNEKTEYKNRGTAV